MRMMVCLLALMVGWIMSVSAGDLVVKPDSSIEVVYISAKDCSYCRSWRYTINGGWDNFSKQPEAKHVSLVTVDKGFRRHGIEVKDYPDGYQHLYEMNMSLGRLVPAFWVLVDRQPVLGIAGEKRWDTDVVPVIIDLVSKKLAGGGTITRVHW